MAKGHICVALHVSVGFNYHRMCLLTE